MAEREEGRPPLTPEELRMVAMLLEGIDAGSVLAEMGIPTETIEEHERAIRRRFEVPDAQPLDRFLREHFGSPRAAGGGTGAAEPAAAPIERRVRLLLRMTLNELLTVAAYADLRGDLLGETVERLRDAGNEEAALEVEDLRRVSRMVRDSVRALLEEIRRRDS